MSKVKIKDNRTESDKGYISGLWYAIEQLVEGEQHFIAKDIIENSNLPEWEFRDNLEQTQFMYDELSEFLDDVFEEEENE